MGLADRVLSWLRRVPGDKTRQKASGDKKQTRGSLKMTKAEKDEALALAKDPCLLSRFLEDLERTGVVGVEQAKIELLLACTSRLLPTPVSVVVKGHSSVGKNFVANAILKTLPPGVVRDISGLSGTVLKYLEADLRCKVVMIAEVDGSADADFLIRTMQSEGKVTFLVTVRDKTSGFRVRKYEVKGPPVFIQTTTKLKLRHDNETRVFDVHMEGSLEQTQRIHAVQRARRKTRESYASMRVAEETVRKAWRNLNRILRPCVVTLPFADQIKFPDRPMRVNRDHERFLTMIEASAAFHQYQREQQEEDGTLYVTATTDDYRIAHQVIRPVLDRTLGTHVRASCELDSTFKVLGRFTVKDVMAATKKPRRTVRRHLDAAVKRGLVKKLHRTGKAQTFESVGGIDGQLLSPEQLEARIKACGQVAVGGHLGPAIPKSPPSKELGPGGQVAAE